MARIVNATPVGATPFEVDVDAETRRTTLQAIAGDAALTYDRLTGENGATGVNHSGAPNGCLLGVPLWQQYIGRSINYVGTGTSKGGSPSLIWLIAHPFFVPRNEGGLQVELHTRGGNFEAMQPKLRIVGTTGLTRSLVPLSFDSGPRGTEVAHCRVETLTAGVNIALLEVNTVGSSLTDLFLISWHGYFRRRRDPVQAVRGQTTVVGVTTPTSTQALFQQSIDSTWVTDAAAWDSYIASRLDRNLNAIEEFGSGWPAGGNVNYTQVDESGGVADATNPSQSRFHAGTKTLLANEGEYDWPLWAEGFGAYGLDGVGVAAVGSVAPTVGMLQWFAPYPTTATLSTYRQVPLRIPDFQSTSSRLKCVILVGSKTSVPNWTGQINIDGSTASAAFGAMFAAGDSSIALSIAQISAVPFVGDNFSLVSLQLSKSTALDGTYEELHLLGACLYWDGT